MSTQQKDSSINRLEAEGFIITESEEGYRVCSPLLPAKQFVVSGLPHDPQCTCPNFVHPDRPPGWQCEHIQAVLKHEGGANGTPLDRVPSPVASGDGKKPPTADCKKSPSECDGRGTWMLLRRSISPDGRIDSLTMEFSCPIGPVLNGETQEQAEKILGLQNSIAAGFLKANSANEHRSRNGNGHNGSGVPQNAVPARLIGIASVNSRFGPKPVLNILVKDRVLKFFGSDKELAEAVKAAGYTNEAKHLAEGMKFDLPCRVVTRPNGRYVNVERVYPAEAEALAKG